MKVKLNISLFKALGTFQHSDYLTVDFETSENIIAVTSKELSLEALKDAALDACWQLNEAGFFSFVNPEKEVIEVSVQCRDLTPQMLVTYIYNHIYHKFVQPSQYL